VDFAVVRESGDDGREEKGGKLITKMLTLFYCQCAICAGLQQFLER
jgi:hypothetical protein